MNNSLFRTDKEINDIYYKYVDMVYKICFTYAKNVHDTEDCVQNTFVKLIKYNKGFDNDEHIKAWLIVTSSNVCKDMLKKRHRKDEPLENFELMLQAAPFTIDETIKEVLKLPDKYKMIIYLYYYEGYSAVEIAKIFGKPDSTVRNHLSEARKMLKNILEERDYYEE